MLVYLKDGSAQTLVLAATLRQKLQTFYLTQVQYATIGPTSLSADSFTPGAWQGSHWSTSFKVTGMTRPGIRSTVKTGLAPRSAALQTGALPPGQRGGKPAGSPRNRSVVGTTWGRYHGAGIMGPVSRGGKPAGSPRNRSVVGTIWGRYHGGQPQSSDDSFYSPTVIPPSALVKPSIMKRYHRRRTCSHTSPRCSPTMVRLHDTRFVECRWWNDGWTVKTVIT